MKKKTAYFLVLTFITLLIMFTFSVFAFTILESRIEPTTVFVQKKFLISCKVTHSGGSAAIKRVAASITNEKINSAYPNLYDDGTHGDKIANDGIYSLEITAPASPGLAKIVFIAVDVGMNEIEAAPVTVNIQ